MIWSELYNRILVHVPGCPEPTIEDAVRQTAIEFCRESKIWEEQLDSVYPVSGISRYEIGIPEESAVVSLASAIQGKTAIEVGEKYWPSINVFGLLHFESIPDPDKGPLEIRAILRPAEDSTGIPDKIGRDYATALIHGAIAELQSMPNKDWSAPNMVGYHQNIFNSRLSDARLSRATGNSESPIRVTPQPFI